MIVNLDLFDSSIPAAASFDILSDAEKPVRRPRKIVSENVDWQSYNVIASRELQMLNITSQCPSF